MNIAVIMKNWIFCNSKKHFSMKMSSSQTGVMKKSNLEGLVTTPCSIRREKSAPNHPGKPSHHQPPPPPPHPLTANAHRETNHFKKGLSQVGKTWRTREHGKMENINQSIFNSKHFFCQPDDSKVKTLYFTAFMSTVKKS